MRAMVRRGSGALLGLVFTVAAQGCASGPSEEEKAAAAAAAAVPVASRELEDATAKVFEDGDAATPAPPHGGAVVGLGGSVAHAEVLVIPDTGQLVVYLLDKDGQAGKRVAQPTIMAEVVTSGRQFSLELEALPEAGEQVGDASRFSARTDDLLRAGEATVTLKWVLVDGQVFSDNIVRWGAL